jgi:uncharacterized protein YjiS (DUF1127 family)
MIVSSRHLPKEIPMTLALMHGHSGTSVLGERSVGSGIGRTIAFVFEALERQRTRRDLASLDDRMLRDIGLSRYEVEMELRRPWWRA